MQNREIKVIAICGSNHGVGKTTFAEFIQDAIMRLIGKRTKVAMYSFAECIKECAEHLIGYSSVWEHKDEPCKYLNGKTGRDLLIAIGEMVKKDFNKSFFVDRVIADIKSDTFNDVFIIDDLRFPIELEELRKAFGNDLTVVYIHGLDEVMCMCEGLINPHDTDYETYNLKDSLGQLYDEAATFVKGVFGIE